MTEHADTRPPCLLDRARAAMPRLAATEDAITAVQARMAAAGARSTPEADVIAAAADEIVRSCAVPDDLGRRLVAVRRANAETFAEIEILRRAQLQLLDAERGLHRDGADAALDVLRGELATIVDAGCAALDALGPDVHDADSAITRGRVDAWQRVRRLAEEHDRLRHVQKIIVSAALAPPQPGRWDDHVTPDARLLVDLLGYVRDGRHTDVAEHLRVAAKGPVAPRYVDGLISGQPRPVNQPAPPPWLTPDPVAALRFITRPDAHPWVPTLAQLAACRAAALSAMPSPPADTDGPEPYPAHAPGEQSRREARLRGQNDRTRVVEIHNGGNR